MLVYILHLTRLLHTVYERAQTFRNLTLHSYFSHICMVIVQLCMNFAVCRRNMTYQMCVYENLLKMSTILCSLIQHLFVQ